MLECKKVYVGKYSKEIQEKAFTLGWLWRDSRSQIMWLDHPFIYFHPDKNISKGNDMFEFNNHCYEEITVKEILKIKVPLDKTIPIGTPGWYNTVNGEIIHTTYKKGKVFKLFNTKKEAEAYAILPTLLYWRDKYNDDWKPDWKDSNKNKYILRYYNGDIEKYSSFCAQHPFAFKTPEIRDKFMVDFREELEIVKSLL